MLAGDLITRALQRGGPSVGFAPDPARSALKDLDQGGTDPENIAEFLVYDIPFEVEPATGLIFPAQVDRE